MPEQRTDSLAQLTAALAAFNAARKWEPYHAPKNLAMCLVAEAGELVEPFMWLTPEQSDALDDATKAHVRDEVGDVLICLTNLCARLGIDPVAAAFDKLVKNGQKYPAP